MNNQPIFICDAEALLEGGVGVRFPVLLSGHSTTGFVVRYQGIVHGYLNRCAHVGIELDWSQGEFFEPSRSYLMCATHGALYDPKTGQCQGGPCHGGRLRKLTVYEASGHIYWLPDEVVKAKPQ